ncbi:MAG: CopG family antitoxin [bacterium]
MKMKKLQIPEFKTYEEEAVFWDNLDSADFMEDDGEWFRFETPNKRAIRIAILPEVADELIRRAHTQRVSVETLVNFLLVEHIRESGVVRVNKDRDEHKPNHALERTA